MMVLLLPTPFVLPSLLSQVPLHQCNVRPLGGWEAGGATCSHLIVVLSVGRRFAVGADDGAVVLQAGGREEQAVREEVVAGGAVGLRRPLLVLAQLLLPQGLQHLAAALQHTQEALFINNSLQLEGDLELLRKKRRHQVVTF